MPVSIQYIEAMDNHFLKKQVLKRLYDARHDGYIMRPFNSLSLTCHDLMDDPFMVSFGFDNVCDMMVRVDFMNILNNGEV